MAGNFKNASELSRQQFEILKPHLIDAINNYRYYPNCADIMNIENEKMLLIFLPALMRLA